MKRLNILKNFYFTFYSNIFNFDSNPINFFLNYIKLLITTNAITCAESTPYIQINNMNSNIFNNISVSGERTQKLKEKLQIKIFMNKKITIIYKKKKKMHIFLHFYKFLTYNFH